MLSPEKKVQFYITLVKGSCNFTLVALAVAAAAAFRVVYCLGGVKKNIQKNP